MRQFFEFSFIIVIFAKTACHFFWIQAQFPVSVSDMYTVLIVHRI